MSRKRLLLFIMEDSKVYYCLSHNVDALRCRSQCFNCLLLVSSGNEVYVNNVTTSDKASGNEVSDRYVLFLCRMAMNFPHQQDLTFLQENLFLHQRQCIVVITVLEIPLPNTVFPQFSVHLQLRTFTPKSSYVQIFQTFAASYR